MTERIAVLIPSHCGGAQLRACLQALRTATADSPLPVSTVVVDNELDPAEITALREQFPDVDILNLYANLGYGPALNRAARKITADYLLFLNDDAILPPNAILKLLEVLRSDNNIFGVSTVVQGKEGLQAAQASAKLSFGRLQITHTVPDSTAPTFFLCGAACLVRREMFLSLGGFAENLFYWEDVELSIRAWRRGWRCLVQPEVRVEHRLEQTSRALLPEPEIRARQAASHYLVLWRHLSRAQRLLHWFWLPWQLLLAPLTGRSYVWCGLARARRVRHQMIEEYRQVYSSKLEEINLFHH